MNPPDPSVSSAAHSRWHFLRDVIVVQLKLVLGNLQNFLLVPFSLGAAVLDLLFKGAREGDRFYKVLDLSRRIDESINLYGAIGGYHATGPDEAHAGDASDKKDFTVDTVVRRVEDVIVREYKKGGTTASVKAAVDRLLDQVQREGQNRNGSANAPGNGDNGDPDKPSSTGS